MSGNANEVLARGYFDTLDALAVEVVSGRTATRRGSTCAEMASTVTRLMGWPDFDLFEEIDFEKVHAEGKAPTVLAYAMLAFLRGEVFRTAVARDMGLKKCNETLAAHSEHWEGLLQKRWEALRAGTDDKQIKLH